MTAQNLTSVSDKINSTSSILIVLPTNPNGDCIASALALKNTLTKLNKDVSVVSPTAPDMQYGFLKDFESISESLGITKNFVIEVGTKRTDLKELSYKKEQDKLAIFLTPKNGEFKPSDVSFKNSDFPFGLIITIGVPALDQLAKLYTNNAELFFTTPVVNIDYKSTNESYGQFNLIELNSTSCSEIVMDLINHIDPGLMDEDIATALLTGIITETNSFQHTRTTPQTFLKASQLVAAGADQPGIVSQIFKNKSLGFLKLWGRALARIKHLQEQNLIYTVITKSDVEKSQVTSKDVDLIIAEMSNQLRFAKIYVVFREVTDETVDVFTLMPGVIDPLTQFKQYNPQYAGPQIYKFTLNNSLIESETLILKLITDGLAKFTV